MAGIADPLRPKPHVFVSYARSDGEVFATRLRRRLESKGIPLWQGRVGMEGGRDWWLQVFQVNIKKYLDRKYF